jgi:hypothetical protein
MWQFDGQTDSHMAACLHCLQARSYDLCSCDVYVRTIATGTGNTTTG